MNIQKYDANGNCILNESYKEILVLDKMLTDAGIPHHLDRFLDGWQICYPDKVYGSIVMDAIEHFGSYGNEQDMLEIQGLLTPEEAEHDSVLGHLTAEEVFVRILNHYLGIKPKKKKRKYRKGGLITSVSELIDQELVYVHNKPTHRGWFMSWQLRYAKDMVDRGVLYKAVKEE